jgi:hypothetical protein
VERSSSYRHTPQDSVKNAKLRGTTLSIHFVELPIQALFRDELIMGTKLVDATLFEHGNGIGLADRGEAMGDDDRGLALHQTLEGLTNEGFRLSIDR